MGWLYFDKVGVSGHVWDKYIYDSADALIKADGSQVLAASEMVADDRQTVKGLPVDAQLGTKFYLFDQGGRRLKSWPSPGDGHFLGFSDDERSFYYEYSGGAHGDVESAEEEDLSGHDKWVIHSRRIQHPGQYYLSPDRTWMLNDQDGHLSGYRLRP